jgi:hypothetical protein
VNEMSLTLQQFVEGCMKFPLVCGWMGGETYISTDDFEDEVEMTVEVHNKALEGFSNLSDAFDYIRDEAKKLFGDALTNIGINETDNDKEDYIPYFVSLRVKYKETSPNED